MLLYASGTRGWRGWCVDEWSGSGARERARCWGNVIVGNKVCEIAAVEERTASRRASSSASSFSVHSCSVSCGVKKKVGLSGSVDSLAGLGGSVAAAG